MGLHITEIGVHIKMVTCGQSANRELICLVKQTYNESSNSMAQNYRTECVEEPDMCKIRGQTEIESNHAGFRETVQASTNRPSSASTERIIPEGQIVEDLGYPRPL